MKFKTYLYLVVSCLVASVSSASAQMVVKDMEESVYARVAGKEIDVTDFKETLAGTVRRKFYHGTIPEGKMQEVQREAGKQLITRELLVQEARRLKLEPDHDWIRETRQRLLDSYEKKYGKHEKWEAYRKDMLSKIDGYLEEESLLATLKDWLDDVPQPDEAQVRKYYRDNPEKFTSPEQYRVSLILLKVAPSSPVVAWDEALEEAQRIHRQLREGADFAALAKLHSADRSAEQGGDMGYLHKGMLAPEIQDRLEKMKPGELSEPLKLLEGVAIFRLQEIKPAVLNPFDKVRERATALLLRDMRDKARRSLIARLWKEKEIVINKKYYSEEDNKDKEKSNGGAGESKGKSSGV